MTSFPSSPLALRHSTGSHACGARVLVPQLEGEQLPDLLGFIAPARALVLDEPDEGLAAKEPGRDELTPNQHVVHELTKVVRHPGAEGRSERRLRAVDD